MGKGGGSGDTDRFAAGMIVGKRRGDVELGLVSVSWGEIDGGGGKFTGPVGGDLRGEIERYGRAGGRVIIGKRDIVGEFFPWSAGLGVGGESKRGLGS